MSRRLAVRAACAALLLLGLALPAQAQSDAATRGSDAIGRGDFPAAIEHLSTAIEQLSTAVDRTKSAGDLLLISRLSRGQAYVLNGQPAESFEDLAIVIDSDQVRDRYRVVALGTRATAHRLLGDHDAAIADFDRAIALGAPGGRIYFDRGLSHEAKGAHARAVEDFLKAYEIDPDNPMITEKLSALGLLDRPRED